MEEEAPGSSRAIASRLAAAMRDRGWFGHSGVSLARVLGLSLGFVAAIGAADIASAEASAEECDRLFPSFTCDREARPAGHIGPMSMPYLFEDPYITSGVQLVGIYHGFPDDSVFDGGEAGVIALQARLAITERLAFIATKDGFTILRPDNALLENHEGFMDVTVGFKYAVIDDREKNLIVTPSLRYEIPIGNDDVLQGRGDGVLIPAVSVGFGPDDVHIVADLGAQVAMDSNHDSSSIFYNFHIDKSFEVDCIPGADFIVPFVELNGISWVDGGDGSATIDLDGPGRASVRAAQDILHGAGVLEHRRFEGADVVNLGSSGVAGEDLVTIAFGTRVPFRNGVSLGFSYERALSQHTDIFEHRATWMLAYDF